MKPYNSNKLINEKVDREGKFCFKLDVIKLQAIMK